MTGPLLPPLRSPPWTAEQDAVLRELWTSGLTCTEIGLKLGKTKSAITGRAHRLELPQRGSPIKTSGTLSIKRRNEDAARVLKLHSEGIAGVLALSLASDVPRKRVAGILKSAGIPTRIMAEKPTTPPGTPMKMPVYNVDPKDLVAGVGGRVRFCQFIPGDPAGERTLYCGKPVDLGRSYCDHHMRICWRPHPIQLQQAQKKEATQ